MMELRIIDGLPFIVQRHGKKEFTRTPEEVADLERRAISDGQAAIADCHIDAESIRQRIESALIAGEPTADLRAELVAVTEQTDGFTDQVAESAETIRTVWKLIDSHTATAIRQAHVSRLTTLLAPFDNILEKKV